MGKKGKKKGSKGEKSTGPQFQSGVGQFEFPNGDWYSGEYCAHRTGLVWRQGRGTYVTHDGQTYEATWNNDKLDETENVKIKFAGGDEFLGRISKNKFDGPGSYVVNNRGCLTANFVANKPAENVVFIDYKENCWYGSAEDERALLYQEHIFFTDLDETLGKGVPKSLELGGIEEESAIAEDKSELDLKESKKLFFAKSPNIDFEDSDWFRNFRQYEEASKIILKKVELEGDGCLSPDEKSWYESHLLSGKILEKWRNRERTPPTDKGLLDRFFSNKYRKSCPAVRVLYASPPMVESGPDPDC